MVIFLTAQETVRHILDDKDGFLRSLTPIDIKARRCKSLKEYVDRVIQSAVDVPDEYSITKQIMVADRFLNDQPYTPWIIGFTTGTVYEDGLPHTRSGVIMLSVGRWTTGTLVHEKIHVQQHFYPDSVRDYITKKGYKKICARSIIPRIVANPDVDEWVYADLNDTPMLKLHLTENPTSILGDTIQHGEYEHPYEEMAYDYENKFKLSDYNK